MEHDDLLKEFGLDGLESSSQDASSQELLDEILREYGLLDEEQEPADSGEYRSYDGTKSYRTFDETLPDASSEDFYRYAPEDQELDDSGEYEDYEDYGEYDYDDDGRRPKKKHRVLRAIGNTLLAICTLLAAFYLLVIYSNIPFLNDLRTQYIQTAMTTYSHKYLATAIVPHELIREVMRDQYETDDAMEGTNSSWGAVDVVDLPELEQPEASEENPPEETPVTQGKPAPKIEETQQEEKLDPETELFFEYFWELDKDSVLDYVEEHPETLKSLVP